MAGFRLFPRAVRASFFTAGILHLAVLGTLPAQDLRLKLDEPRLRMSLPSSAPKSAPDAPASSAPAAAPSAAAAGPAMNFQPTTFTTWLDFQRLAANRWIPGELPAWLEPVAATTVKSPNGAITTTFRLRFPSLSTSGRSLQLRLFFDDQENANPQLLARSSDGAVCFEYGPFGGGFGLPTSEMLVIPTAKVASIEISVPGDGRNVRGVLLALLASQEVQRGVDFAEATDVIDPFDNLPPAMTRAADLALFGRVRAVIDADGLKLSPETARRGVWEFSLQAPPLLAVITYEVLNGDSLAPLETILNDRPLGASSVHWPDLADPGYLGLSRPLEKDMRFRYTGWLRAQKVIPGSALRAGLNTLILQLHPDSGPLAIRAVELQLKYNWKNLDYRLAPTIP